MSLPTFNWNSRVTVSGNTTGCEERSTTKLGKTLLVSDTDGEIDRELIGAEYPAIAVSSSDSQTRLRSGSSNQPIRLSRLWSKIGGSLPRLLAQSGDGTIYAWKAARYCGNRILKVSSDGGISAEPDINSRIFDMACEGTLSEATHVAAGVSFTDCDGTLRIRQLFIPKAQFLSEVAAEVESIINP